MQTVPLCELGEIVSGSTPKTGVPKFWDGDIPWITPADLSNHEGIYFHGTPKKISKAGFDSCSTAMLPAGSILFSSRAPIGHCALTAYPACTNQGFKNIVPNKRLDPVYGYFALKFLTPGIVAMGRGATFAEINKELFESVQVPYCDLPEQRRIAVQLEQADRLCRTRRYALELTDTFLPAAFLELFGSVRDSRWDRSTLGELTLDFSYGTSTKCSDNSALHAVLRIPNVIRGAIDTTDLKFGELSQKEQKKLRLEHGDLLFVRTNGNPDYVGRCAVFDLEADLYFASYLIRARTDQKLIAPVFLAAYLRMPDGRRSMQPSIRTTAGQYNVSVEGLRDVHVIVP